MAAADSINPDLHPIISRCLKALLACESLDWMLDTRSHQSALTAAEQVVHKLQGRYHLPMAAAHSESKAAAVAEPEPSMESAMSIDPQLKGHLIAQGSPGSSQSTSSATTFSQSAFPTSSAARAVPLMKPTGGETLFQGRLTDQKRPLLDPATALDPRGFYLKLVEGACTLAVRFRQVAEVADICWSTTM